MIETKSMKQPFSLKLSSSLFVLIWCLIASFPIIWIAVKSIKLPIDAFSSKPIAVIFGAEDKGISKGILKMLNNQVKIPMKQHSNSLNVSVASAVVLYEIVRQRIK